MTNGVYLEKENEHHEKAINSVCIGPGFIRRWTKWVRRRSRYPSDRSDVEFLKNHDLIDPNRIGLVGHSQAGWIIPLATSKSPDVAFMIISSGPVTTVGQEIYYSDLVEGDEAESTEISLQEASDMARDYAGPHGYDPMPSLQELNIPGLWLLGAQDDSIPIPLTIENIDSLVADYGKDFSHILYENKGHGWTDVDTGQMYPVLSDALNWLEEKFME